MAEVKITYSQILKKLGLAGEQLKEEQVSSFLESLVRAYRSQKVYIWGAGRSGLVGRAFAQRLGHLGFNVYFLEDTVIKPMDPGDILICISGSGSTKSTLARAESAKEIGGKVIAITSYAHSPLGSLADLVVEVPGRELSGSMREYEARQLRGEHEPLTPMGTVFELSCSVFLDSMISQLAKMLGVKEEEMEKRHANIE